MPNDYEDVTTLQQQAQTRREIEQAITQLFAPEDEALRSALAAAKEAGLPLIQISPIQGKLLQLLAAACNARKILEIGSLAGYSGIWLARALPAGGRLITLEINPKHAEVVRDSFKRAGVADRSEVRVGKALDLLPQLEGEAPFDLVFIDADKTPYPQYLDWALRLTRPGSIIVADNCVRGKRLWKAADQDEVEASVYEYNRRAASDPRLVSLALAIDNDATDGFTISVVRQD
ncbi:MAG TPA: O-methyltransferase [Ktedonobacteraceae bacterium]|jgi:caffeoyl-CoA O-methyltransferase|nr:O-methyltransferase [Ktedonobacteraceae bacterium]